MFLLLCGSFNYRTSSNKCQLYNHLIGGVFLFYEKVTKYCEDNNITVCAFEKMCDLPNGLVSKWKETRYPTVETLNKIASATKIPISEWIK